MVEILDFDCELIFFWFWFRIEDNIPNIQSVIGEFVFVMLSVLLRPNQRIIYVMNCGVHESPQKEHLGFDVARGNVDCVDQAALDQKVIGNFVKYVSRLLVYFGVVVDGVVEIHKITRFFNEFLCVFVGHEKVFIFEFTINLIHVDLVRNQGAKYPKMS